MQFRIRSIPTLLWLALKKFLGDGGPGMAGALSFATVFSLPALLALLLMTVGKVMDPDTVQEAIIGQVRRLIGRDGAQQISGIISKARDSDINPSLTAILGLVTVLFGSTAAFASLQTSLNKTWNVKPDPKRGEIRNFLAKRVFSFGVVMVVAFLLLVSLSVSALLGALAGRTAHLEGIAGMAMIAANFLFSIAVVTTLFAAMFKLLPDADVAWRDVWVGALFTTILFAGGKELIGFYLGSSNPGSAYGAAGSLVLVLLWIYYSSWIVLYGAELTRFWADMFGRGVRPERGAIEYVEQEKTVAAG
ncbi:MAG TPA: YihY/virulence factor BrkB family protein [Gemmatimonadaceae bacterium]|nr:YihY/virulence factor BrkB family protein [Gemmatimonadaceae bacterium]